MRILVLDTSQIQAAMCVLEGDLLKAELSGSVDVSHSEALLRHLHELLKQASLEIKDIDAFAAGVGPGSFTGIRIGCATVKALAQVTAKPVLPFSSLRATALALGEGRNVVSVVNAYQGQVFVGWWAGGTWHEDAMTAHTWCAQHGEALAKIGGLTFCGTGAELYRAEFEALPRAEFSSSAYVTALGMQRALKDVTAVHYSKLVANYLRPSQAEVKLGVSLAK